MEIERLLEQIKINVKGHVQVIFSEIIRVSDESGDSPAVTYMQKHKFNSDIPAHYDLTGSLRKLRKMGMSFAEVELAEKQITQWETIQLNIAGDYILEKSRAVIVLGKKVKATGKVIPFVCPQFAMWPQEDEEGAKKEMFDPIDVAKATEIILDVIEEVWQYLDGKKTGVASLQMSLFPQREGVAA